MDSNFQWQKQRANERINNRLQNAEQHRQAKQANGREPFIPPLKIIIPGLFLVILAFWLLTGCTLDSSPSEAAINPENHVPQLTLADKIRFQNERDASFNLGNKFSPTDEWTLAARITFQDKRDAYLLETGTDTATQEK